jgi:hypothetical protein
MSGFRGKVFEIPITRSVEAVDLSWPSAEERRSETLGGNRDYFPLGRATWSEAREFFAAERSILDRIAGAGDWEDCFYDWLEECEEDPFLYGFDLGTNALSAALAAARCLPFYACNGGAFDDGHNDTYPLVAFFCRPALPDQINCDARWNLLRATSATSRNAFTSDSSNFPSMPHRIL